MKNLHEKIAKLTEFLVLDDELKRVLKTIIKSTYTFFCDEVERYEVKDDGKSIVCMYVYTCRGESYTYWCYIPIMWLEDGYDYKADFVTNAEEMIWKSEEERKRRAEEEKKKEWERKEKAEYETYLKLKEKYELGS